MPLGRLFLTQCRALTYHRCMNETATKPSGRLPKPVTRRAAPFRKRGASLGLGGSDTRDLMRQVERGFSFEALLRLTANSGLSLAVLASVIGVPERTLARRKASGKLEPDESERLLRISNLFEKSVQLFEGDVPAAVNWLTSPKKALDRQTPLLYARSELGAREVEDLIGRLDHGIFS
jgi:putative toxin-antitoxin system antitoxin component (TIGR02293 family)